MKLLTTPDDLGPCQVYCEQLKDEVRRLDEGWKAANGTILDIGLELTALREQRCETCRYRIEPDTRCSIARCAKLSVPGHSVAMVTCAAVNYRCGAWLASEAKAALEWREP